MEINEIKYARSPEESYSEYAYRVMRDWIMKFKLVPGAPINESEVAEALNVSRTPVHEALARLKEERLVDIQPRKESRVSKIDMVLVNDGIFIRSCVEPELIQTLQGNIAAPIMHRMLRNINLQRQLLQTGDPEDIYNDVDDEFHMLLYLAANRENLYGQVHRMVAHYNRVRYLARSIGNFQEIDERSYQDHREIFSAVAYRTPMSAKTRELIRGHITQFHSRMDEMMDLYGDYFIML